MGIEDIKGVAMFKDPSRHEQPETKELAARIIKAYGKGPYALLSWADKFHVSLGELASGKLICFGSSSQPWIHESLLDIWQRS